MQADRRGLLSRRTALTAGIAGLPAAGFTQQAAAFGRPDAPWHGTGAFGVRAEADGDANTRALNEAVRSVAIGGGGTLVFETSPSGYRVNGPVILPSNVVVDLNGQTLRGRRRPGDALFVTGTVLADGSVRSNLDSPPETALVAGTSIRNGRIEDCQRVFHLRNFGRNCSVRDIVTSNCTQVGKFERCFFSTFSNISSSGFSDAAIPVYHFLEQTNAVTLHRLNIVAHYGLCVENGASSLLVDGLTFEGGQIGIAVIGDALGVQFRGCYFEAVEGRAFDMRRAGVCTIDWEANYFNHVDIVLDDGSLQASSTLMGTWQPSNFIVMAETPGFSHLKPARRQMRIDGPRNFVLYHAPYTNGPEATVPDNWLTSPGSRVMLETGFTGSSLTDVRARAAIFSGIVPTVRSGDSGTPPPGQVPFARVAAGRGSNASLDIATRIAWQPASLFARYILIVNDDTGSHRMFGDIYGSDVVAQEPRGKPLSIHGKDGWLHLSVTGLDARRAPPTCTGTVQMST